MNTKYKNQIKICNFRFKKNGVKKKKKLFNKYKLKPQTDSNSCSTVRKTDALTTELW